MYTSLFYQHCKYNHAIEKNEDRGECIESYIPELWDDGCHFECRSYGGGNKSNLGEGEDEKWRTRKFLI